MQQLWIPEKRKTTVCIDSYQEGVPQGRLYGPDGEIQVFHSLTQFLVIMEDFLNQLNEPQADTTHRSFCVLLQPPSGFPQRESLRKGARATFELQVLFRQHTSWQGTILWREGHQQESFRSVLELVLLMDSALREGSGQEAG